MNDNAWVDDRRSSVSEGIHVDEAQAMDISSASSAVSFQVPHVSGDPLQSTHILQDPSHDISGVPDVDQLDQNGNGQSFDYLVHNHSINQEDATMANYHHEASTSSNHFHHESPHSQAENLLGYAVVVTNDKISAPFEDCSNMVPGADCDIVRTRASRDLGLANGRKLPVTVTGFPRIVDCGSNLVYYEVLGKGFNGEVHRAKVRGFGTCAVKKFIRGARSEQQFTHNTWDLREITSSVELCHHPHIVSIYGLLYQRENDEIPSGLVIEYMGGGTLSKFLRSPYAKQITEKNIVSYAEQIANALMFMHGSKYIHRDVKPENILMDSTFKTTKLCDFGLSRDIDTTMTSSVGTLRYVAPEVLSDINNRTKYSSKADVYSFAMVVYEMYHKVVPFSEIINCPIRELIAILGNKYPGKASRPIITEPMDIDMKSKVIECGWFQDEKFRLSMSEIVHILSEISMKLDIRDSHLLYRPIGTEER